MTKYNYEWVTSEAFDCKLEDLVVRNSGSLLTIPGIYEILSEHFNNEILDALRNERNNG